MLHYRKKIFLLLAILLLIFALLFIIALVNPDFHFFDIGIPDYVQNKVILVLSFLSLCLVVWNLSKV